MSSPLPFLLSSSSRSLLSLGTSIAMAIAIAFGSSACEESVDRRGILASPKATNANGLSERGPTKKSPDVDDPTSDEAPLSSPPPVAGDGGLPTKVPAASFVSASNCSRCHKTIYDQWTRSMHSRALTTPLTMAQTNEITRRGIMKVTNPDGRRICINCHAPNAALVTKDTEESLPLPKESLGDEGVACQSCHQFAGKPASGGGGYSTAYQKGLAPGRTVFGTLPDPVATPFHDSKSSDAFVRPNTMCANCHNVNYDNNHDGIIAKGTDLVLQQTWDEYVTTYRLFGGQETCVTCHMPALSGMTRVADGANIGSDQAKDAPPRTVRDHTFVGVDYALEDAEQTARTRPAREALLKGAATIFIDGNSITATESNVAFTVTVGNTGTGHNLPSGFAFARQMWLEVKATGLLGELVGFSGVLAKPTDDLCDADTLNDLGSPTRRFVQGCAVPDSPLVNLQQKLVDQVQLSLANGLKFDALLQPVIEQGFFGKEAFLQQPKGGAVQRTRVADGLKMGTLKPFEFKNFAYDLPTFAKPVRLTVRLLFRNLPPYLLRTLASTQTAADGPALAPLVDRLETIEMGRADFLVL
ncbi:MAG: cytochrome c family protein [Polyangiaceae bacterium]